MYAEVHHVKQLSPDVLRVVLTGGTLDQFEGAAATDAYINARFVPAGSPITVPFSQDDLAKVPDHLRPRPHTTDTSRSRSLSLCNIDFHLTNVVISKLMSW